MSYPWIDMLWNDILSVFVQIATLIYLGILLLTFTHPRLGGESILQQPECHQYLDFWNRVPLPYKIGCKCQRIDWDHAYYEKVDQRCHRTWNSWSWFISHAIGSLLRLSRYMRKNDGTGTHRAIVTWGSGWNWSTEDWCHLWDIQYCINLCLKGLPFKRHGFYWLRLEECCPS